MTIRIAEALVELHRQAGNPMLRDVVARADGAISESTISRALNGRTRPSWETVRAIIVGLGGDPRKYRTIYEQSYPNGLRYPGRDAPDDDVSDASAAEDVPKVADHVCSCPETLDVLRQILGEIRGLRTDRAHPPGTR